MRAQIEIDSAVYIQSIEIGENRGPWSVVAIKAWDSGSGLWQTLYKGTADKERYKLSKTTYQYNKFIPSPFCETTFKTSVIRIELDTYTIDDWNELDYVKVIGATESKAGVLNADAATQTARVIFLPDPNFNGQDSFRFQGCDCAYDSARTSEEAIVTVDVVPVNDKPIAQSSSASVECAPGVADIITLRGDDIDAYSGCVDSDDGTTDIDGDDCEAWTTGGWTCSTNYDDSDFTVEEMCCWCGGGYKIFGLTSLAYSIDELPSGADLLDAVTGESISLENLSAPLSGSEVRILADYTAETPPSSFAFAFFTTDEHGATSASAKVEVTCRATRCDPGNYFDMEARSCLACPAGTFAPGTAVRSSCNACAAGKFTASEGSVSCGSCANGQVALKRGSKHCSACPDGATCDDTSNITISPGYWRPLSSQSSDELLDIYTCPIVEACPGGNGYRCAEGFVGPLCSHCGRQYFLSWCVRITR